MSAVFGLLERLLPFEWVSYDFMKNAFLAILLITPVFGMMGTTIVSKKMAFFSDALGHSALTGVALGILLGVGNTNVSMIVFAVLFALALNKLKSGSALSADTLISVFSSCSIALGLVILSRGGNFSKYSDLLVGDILSVSWEDVVSLLAVFAAVIVFWVLCFNRLNAASINASLAKSRGIPVRLLDNLFALLLAVIVMFSIRWVGILLINALLILPAAAAKNISSNMREYNFFSILFSMFSGILGLIVSFYVNVAAGPMIVLIASVIFFATYCYKK